MECGWPMAMYEIYEKNSTSLIKEIQTKTSYWNEKQIISSIAGHGVGRQTLSYIADGCENCCDLKYSYPSM